MEGGGTLPKTIPGPMRSYPVKENPIGSGVSEILQYRQTDTQTDTQADTQTKAHSVIIRIIVDALQLLEKHFFANRSL